MKKIDKKTDFKGVVAQYEVVRYLDCIDNIHFKLDGQDISFRIPYAGFRLDIGEHIQVYGEARNISALEVINPKDSSIKFRWVDASLWSE